MTECNYEFVSMPDYETADKICKWAVLTKCMVEVFGQGDSFDEMLENVDWDWLNYYIDMKKTITFRVEGMFKKLSEKEKIARIDWLDVFPFD